MGKLRGVRVALCLLGALVPGAFAQLGLAPTITVQPVDEAVKKGGSVTFTVQASSDTFMSYQWYKNSNSIAGANSSSYTRNNLDFPDAGFYHVVVANLVGGRKSDVVQLTVLSNEAPAAADDFFIGLEDVPLNIPAAGILTNDTDADGDALTAMLVSNVTQGTLSLNANGGFIYTPGTNWNGVDTFTYRPRDPVATGNLATVVIMIDPVNDSPIARNDNTNTLEDTSVTVKVLLNDSEVEGETLTITSVSTTNGTVVISGTNIVFTPSLHFVGTEVFSYTISDGVNAVSANAVVTVTAVNDLPVANDDAYSTPEDVPLAIPAVGILANDADVDGDALTSLLVSNVTRGTLSLNSNGSFTYVPGANYSGSDSFRYRPLDATSALTILQQSTISRTRVEIKQGQKGAQSFRHGSAGQPSYSISKVVLHLSRESTLPNTTLNFNIGTGVNSGALAGSSVAIAPSNITNITSGSSFQTYEILFGTPVGPLAAGTNYYLNLECEASNGRSIWSAYDDQNGYPRGTYYKGGSDDTRDMLFQVIGGTNTLAIAPATVTITITPVNDPPVANNDTTNTVEDTSVTIGVLRNDSDVEGPITITGVSTTNGTASISGTNIVFIPSTNFNGTAVFSYTISDGTNSATANVTVTVTAVNDPPVTYGDVYNTAEDVALTIAAPGILTNDVDVDSGSLTAVLVTSASQGSLALNANGSFSYTPNLNFNGADSFTYRARDGTVNGNVATVTLNVTPVNDVPVANNDSTNTLEDIPVTIRVLANDTDVEGGPLSVSSTSTTNGTAVISGTNVVFTPAANYFGTVVFSYVVSDGTNSATANVTVNVISVNDAPPVATNDIYTTAEDVRLTVAAPGVLGNDWDVDKDLFSALLVSNVTRGTLSFNANGSFNYTPNTNYWGTDSFTYRATDGMATGNTATVTINVTYVNDPPVARSDTTNTLEDTSVVIDVLANDTDVEDDFLLIMDASTTNGTAVTKDFTTIVFTPATNFFGTVFFTYTVSDGVYSATSSVTVTVVSVNDAPPVATSDSYTTAEDTPLTIGALGVLSNDTDVDADPVTALVESNVSHGILTLNANGSFTYRPATNFHGTDSFSYRATDGLATGNVATVNITVTPINDAPLPINDVTNTLEDTSVIIRVLGNDSDVEGTVLSITGTSTTNGTAVVMGTNIVFTPPTNFNGTVVFSYTVSDGTNSATASVNVTVVPVNDVPVALNDSASTQEDRSVTINVLANDSDVERAFLTVTSVSSTNGTAVINGTNIVYTPATNYFGTAILNYTMSDGTNSATAQVTVTVTAVNDVAIGTDDSYSTTEDVRLIIAAPGILANDIDAENNSLTALLVTSVSHGSLTLNGNGGFTYTPASNYFGSDSFTYRVWDGSGNSAITTARLTTRLDTPLKIVSAGVVTNGFRLQVLGPTPAAYTIVASSNNVDWTPIGSRVAWSGPVEFTDTNASMIPSCFYAATVPSQSTIILEGNAAGGDKLDLRLGKNGSQAFRHGVVGEPDYTVSKVVVRLSRQPTLPNANLIFSIGTGVNAGALPGSTVAINPASISNTSAGNNFQTYEILFTVPVGPLASGVTYYLNFEFDPTNGARMYLESSGTDTAYSNGSYYRGGSPQPDDAVFELWGQ